MTTAGRGGGMENRITGREEEFRAIGGISMIISANRDFVFHASVLEL